jgi:hypothetical protein
MAQSGWKQLVAGAPWFRGEGGYPIGAYSEFMPPPRAGGRPYGLDAGAEFDEADPWGWPVGEAEEALELRPGLEAVAGRLVKALVELAHGRPVHGLARHKLADNPAWPDELASRAGRLGHERYVVLLPLALSRTQDDKGRVRWTLFGGSEQGPARAFWRSFFTAPRRQAPGSQGEDFLRRLLQTVYGESAGAVADLRRAGLRILPLGDDLGYPWRGEEPWPDWAGPLRWARGQPLRGVRYLLTFRPFAALPRPVRSAYLEGRLCLLPCPGSLLFWGVPGALHLQKELPLALQIPLLHLLERHEGPHGLRVPQAGWMHEPQPAPGGERHPHHAHPDDPQLATRNTYQRTHRFDRFHRLEDPLEVLDDEDKLAHVLFSTEADEMGLYGKPMARNVQLWTHDNRLLLDGPRATVEELQEAARRVAEGGLFGYRFQFPALRVGHHEVYWHRPLAAYHDPESGRPAVLREAPLGYLTAYRADRPDLDPPVELWPRPLQRRPHLEALSLFEHPRDPHPHETALNARLLLDACHLAGHPLPRSFAGRLLVGQGKHTLDDWLASLPGWAADPERGARLAEELGRCLEPAGPDGGNEGLPDSLTFRHTSRRSFEVAYWKAIARLAEGRYLNKSNADCVLDPPTQACLKHHQRDLEPLGDYLLSYYGRVIEKARLRGKAWAGELPFRWETDFAFPWMGGWLKDQEGHLYERNLVVMIPGKDRGRAVIMADHYDTAYMLDRYDPKYGGTGARLAAAGADDNHSATAALMQAAPVFLGLSREGRLGCDVWLVHLTGEEFPSDCLGARHLSQLLVEGRLKARLANGRWRDLSGVRVQGVYVLDMVAHNSKHGRDVFQIAPGMGRQSLWLAEQAHRANEAWNAAVPVWNRRAGRKGRGRRSPDGSRVPATAAHLPLRGEVRLPANPHSTLYNTDGQVFSDAGIPVVLFMENYDINRTGYHDTQDTMGNIDLDYGAALAAIAIEAVARAASTEGGRG